MDLPQPTTTPLSTVANPTPDVYKNQFSVDAAGNKINATDPAVLAEQKKLADAAGNTVNPDIAIGNLFTKGGVVQSSDDLRRKEEETRAAAMKLQDEQKTGTLPGFTKDNDGFYVDPKTGNRFFEPQPGAYQAENAPHASYDPKTGKFMAVIDGVTKEVSKYYAQNGRPNPNGEPIGGPSTGTDSSTAFLGEGLAGLQKIRDSLGILSDAERAQIKASADAQGAEFDVLIRDAEEKKRQGRARASVGAGEIGGFMNTQFAGLAALVPTEGGNFEGAGGQLEYIKSEYDRGIADLNSKKIVAMQAARVAAETAIRTGKVQDYQLAKDYFNTVKETFTLQQQLANEKVDAIAKAQKLQDDTRKSNLSWLKDTLAAGVNLDDKSMAEFDKEIGVTGFSKAYSQTLKKAENMKTQEDQVGLAKDLVDLLDKIPVGTTIPIQNADGSTTEYQGMKSKDLNVQIFKETDRKTGKEVIIEYNKDTKEVTVIPTGVSVKSTGGGSGAAASKAYFTEPDPTTGEIQYLYGDKKSPQTAVKLSKQQYLEGVSKAEGVLGTEQQESKFINDDWIKETFDITSGWIKGSVEDQVKEINDFVSKYRSAGYTDKQIFQEILKNQ